MATQVLGEVGASSVAGEARDADDAVGSRQNGAGDSGGEQSPADQAKHNHYKSPGQSQTCGNFSVYVDNTLGWSPLESLSSKKCERP